VAPPPPPIIASFDASPALIDVVVDESFSESGVSDLLPSVSLPAQSLANRAAATASHEEAGAGRVFMAGVRERFFFRSPFFAFLVLK